MKKNTKKILVSAILGVLFTPVVWGEEPGQGGNQNGANSSYSNNFTSTGNAIGSNSSNFAGNGNSYVLGNADTTNNANIQRPVFAANGTIIPTTTQNIFNDPGTGANITGIPLIWYYVDAFGMLNCDGLSDPIVHSTEYVTISFQQDCPLAFKVNDSNLRDMRPTVNYVSDLPAGGYYQPLGVMMIQANWDASDQVNMFTILKNASNFVAQQVNGFDKVLLVGDIQQRNVSSQRAIEGSSKGLTVTPSISSAFGRDGLTGSMFGYGQTDGESHPVSRTGITLLVVGQAPGPWAGRKPNVTQADYFRTSPINDNKSENHEAVVLDKAKKASAAKVKNVSK